MFTRGDRDTFLYLSSIEDDPVMLQQVQLSPWKLTGAARE